MGFTNGGKNSYRQAKSVGLSSYYDEYMGTYLIPMYSFNNDKEIREKVLSLLTNGHCYNADGSIDFEHRLVMEVMNHINEEGEMENNVYDVCIREAEVYS